MTPQEKPQEEPKEKSFEKTAEWYFCAKFFNKLKLIAPIDGQEEIADVIINLNINNWILIEFKHKEADTKSELKKYPFLDKKRMCDFIKYILPSTNPDENEIVLSSKNADEGSEADTSSNEINKHTTPSIVTDKIIKFDGKDILSRNVSKLLIMKNFTDSLNNELKYWNQHKDSITEIEKRAENTTPDTSNNSDSNPKETNPLSAAFKGRITKNYNFIYSITQEHGKNIFNPIETTKKKTEELLTNHGPRKPDEAGTTSERKHAPHYLVFMGDKKPKIGKTRQVLKFDEYWNFLLQTNSAPSYFLDNVSKDMKGYDLSNFKKYLEDLSIAKGYGYLSDKDFKSFTHGDGTDDTYFGILGIGKRGSYIFIESIEEFIEHAKAAELKMTSIHPTQSQFEIIFDSFIKIISKLTSAITKKPDKTGAVA